LTSETANFFAHGYHITQQPDNFASSVATGNVSVVDFKTGELIRIVRSGNGAEGIDVSPDGREVWVTNRGENTISVFNAGSFEKVATLPAGDFPIRGRFTPDGIHFSPIRPTGRL